MKIIDIQKSQQEIHLRKIRTVFKRKKRPTSTPIYCTKIVFKQDDPSV